ncbi:MAG TPA: 8-amino-7-oxononanoate synthase [Verrucomicrobiae bacterium]|nr:8-amino-7-oxononanoate synthase [Verrucomicrobiae bacterium]
MNEFDAELQRRLGEIRRQDLHRELRRVDSPQSARLQISGREFLNFSSNDYLGLANHPRLIEASVEGARRYGSGSGASRLICGSLACHHELEAALAAFKGTEAALSFSSGYTAAIGTIGALAGKDDVIVLDKLVHASIVDAARLSGAKLRIFAHNDLNNLEEILRWADQRASPASDVRQRTLIVTESVFSMDGDLAPLKEIVALKEKHGAWLMVDEAHATGLFGKHRRGVAEELGVSDGIEIQMGTLGKALGASGGYIAGSRALIEYLINRARSFIFSTAPVPAAAAAARAAVELVQSDEGLARRNLLWSLISELKTGLAKNGWPLSDTHSAIIPLIIGAEADAVKTATALRDAGIFVPAIRYPTVARGQARLRVTLTAAHSPADVTRLLSALAPLATQPHPASSHA